MWYSKDDVLKDLAECTGVQISDFDDDYIVRGSRPPPRPKHIEDNDELQLRFGGCGDLPPFNGNSGPDLSGITKMLRMVNTFDKPEEMHPSPKAQETNNEAENKTIIITKLNPNVREFIPSSVRNNKQLNDNSKEMSANITANKTTIPENNTVQSDDESKQLEKEKLVALLKSKITAASKNDSLEKKREKNVAMAALLRLHTGPPATPSNTSSGSTPKCPSPMMFSNKSLSPRPELIESPKNEEKPLVLFTPDYFAEHLSSPTVLIVEDTNHTIPEPSPLLVTPVKAPSPRDLIDPQIKESIEKVNNWFKSPTKKPKAKALVPHIGPVTFKKKESISPKSPSSEVSLKSDPVRDIPAFIPSKYAAELAKDLEARVKAKEEKAKKDQPPLDMWTKLEIELKARDEVVKKRLKKQAENADESN